MTHRATILAAACVCALASVADLAQARQAAVAIPDTPLRFGAFSAQFRRDGTFSLAGEGWPSMQGTWTMNGSEVVMRLVGAPLECAAAARYTLAVNGDH